MSDQVEIEEPETLILPLDAWHRARGGRMVPFAGYHMPVQYEGIMAEHLWTRDSAGLFDVSHMGQLRLSGEGVEAALEAILPTALTDHPFKKARYSLLLNESGGILDDLMLTRLPGDLSPDPFYAPQPPFVSSEGEERVSDGEERFSTSLETNGAGGIETSGTGGIETSGTGGIETSGAGVAETNGGGGLNSGVGEDGSSGVYMVVNGAMKWDDIAHLREYLPDEVTLNHLEDHALLALQGPQAAAAFARVVPGVERLTFMQGDAFDWNGTPLWISRSGYTGEDGFEISVPAEAATALADAICAQPEVRPIGLGARDSLRLEAGLPLYGHDLDTETTPVMADLGFALMKRRREGGGFPGAERIALEREQGAVVKRVGLLVEGRQPVREGAVVLDADGSEVGRITSGGHAPTQGGPIAMGYVPAALSEPGTVVRLSQRGKVHQATVTAMPFVPHRYHRGVK